MSVINLICYTILGSNKSLQRAALRGKQNENSDEQNERNISYWCHIFYDYKTAKTFSSCKI
jgi:hypothetical protein